MEQTESPPNAKDILIRSKFEKDAGIQNSNKQWESFGWFRTEHNFGKTNKMSATV